jgi:DNA polymerase III delta subunit
VGLLPDPSTLLSANRKALLVVGRADILAVLAASIVQELRRRHGGPVEMVTVDVSGRGPQDLRGTLPPSLFPVPRCLRVTGAGSLGKEDARKTADTKKAEDISMVTETIAELAPDDFVLLLAEPPEAFPGWKKYVHPLASAGIPGLGVVALETPNDRALLSWLAERCRAARVEADPKLLRHLVESSSGDLLALTGEVEKLALAFAGGKADLASAGALVTQIPEDDVFALTNALIAGRRDKVLALLEELATAGEEPIYLVAIVASQVRTLLSARYALDAGMAPGEVARSLHRPAHVAKALVDVAAKLPYETLVEAFGRLASADRAMKSSPHPPAVILETTLFTLFSPPPMGYSYLATLEEGEAT